MAYLSNVGTQTSATRGPQGRRTAELSSSTSPRHAKTMSSLGFLSPLYSEETPVSPVRV